MEIVHRLVLALHLYGDKTHLCSMALMLLEQWHTANTVSSRELMLTTASVGILVEPNSK